MTSLLYQTDSYLKEFEATVVNVSNEIGAIELDKTSFYPGGGGQLCDKGVILHGGETLNVIKVKKQGDIVWHYIEGNLPCIGSKIIGKLDWEYRYNNMRTHTAMHILCGIVWRDYKAQVTGGDMDSLEARMDFEVDNFDKEFIEELERKANEEIKNHREIRVSILPIEEAFQIPDLIRTKINLLPKGINEIRTVEIIGLDLQADGGTHVKNTEEVGKINIVKFKSKGKNNKRIYVEIE